MVGVSSWSSARRLGIERRREREVERVHERDRLVAHSDDELRLDDVELPGQPAAGRGGILGAELEAVGAVDGERVDREALQRLEERLTRPPEERDAFLRSRSGRAGT